jgi:hypothetical protein
VEEEEPLVEISMNNKRKMSIKPLPIAKTSKTTSKKGVKDEKLVEKKSAMKQADKKDADVKPKSTVRPSKAHEVKSLPLKSVPVSEDKTKNVKSAKDPRAQPIPRATIKAQLDLKAKENALAKKEQELADKEKELGKRLQQARKKEKELESRSKDNELKEKFDSQSSNQNAPVSRPQSRIAKSRERKDISDDSDGRRSQDHNRKAQNVTRRPLSNYKEDVKTHVSNSRKSSGSYGPATKLHVNTRKSNYENFEETPIRSASPIHSNLSPTNAHNFYHHANHFEKPLSPPKGYNVQLSDRPVFLRRTTLKPTTLKFTETPRLVKLPITGSSDTIEPRRKNFQRPVSALSIARVEKSTIGVVTEPMDLEYRDPTPYREKSPVRPNQVQTDPLAYQEPVVIVNEVVRARPPFRHVKLQTNLHPSRNVESIAIQGKHPFFDLY